jgi:hypothetical protein
MISKLLAILASGVAIVTLALLPGITASAATPGAAVAQATGSVGTPATLIAAVIFAMLGILCAAVAAARPQPEDA